ncbi:hypothetical protein KIW84_072385 [Lathyrus oleraceus]|uniref:GH3 middle domain-containing protein n=1 Tax=Pisum sativum TaxID=3888 RepID=A0A9D4VM55_PEA|nr:hypothetical protein KIW84_072385 [Pisum sativum]
MSHKNIISWNTVIAGYLHNNMVEQANKLFDMMPGRDNFLWALMITCYTRKGKLVKDLVSYNSMLAGYTQNRKMRLAMRFFFSERMIERNVVSWNLMVVGHGKILEARKLFDTMPCKNVVPWNVMIATYVQDLQIDEVVKLFKEMPYEDCVLLLQIRRYVYHDVVRMDDAAKLIDCSYIQSYKTNSVKVVFLNQRPAYKRACVSSASFTEPPPNIALCISSHTNSAVIGQQCNSRDEEIKESSKVSCILHMDSLKGHHKGLENIIQSYLCEEQKELVKLVDVKLGQEYELVVTTYAELYRYRICYVLKVVGFKNKAPQFNFVCRETLY